MSFLSGGISELYSPLCPKLDGIMDFFIALTGMYFQVLPGVRVVDVFHTM